MDKSMKSYFSKLILVLATVCLIIVGAPCNAIGNNQNDLSFDKDGLFKIMVIADVQDGANVSRYTIDLIEKSIEQEDPDLVVFNGDNIFGLSPSLLLSPDNIRKSIDQFTKPIIDNNIPFVVVFGNHDGQTIMKESDQLDYYQSLPGNLTERGTVDKRLGTFNLPIYGDNSTPELNLWFFHSGDWAITEYGLGYAYVLDEQIEWYESKNDELKNANEGQNVPSVVFQHMAVPEIYELLKEVDADTEGAIKGTGKHSHQYFVLDSASAIDGTLNEGPCPPDYNNGEFDSWVEQGDVMAAVFGHDHINDFRGVYEGIELIYTPGVGFYSYGNGYQHGVRVMEFDVNDVENYGTRMIYYDDLINDPIPQELLYDGAFMRGDVYIYITLGCVLIFVITISVIYVVRKKRQRKTEIV